MINFNENENVLNIPKINKKKKNILKINNFNEIEEEINPIMNRKEFNKKKIDDFIEFALDNFSLLELRYLKDKLEKEGLVEMKNEKKNINCGICLKESENLMITDCGHTFCEDCLKDWVSKNNSCPKCNNIIYKDEYNKSSNFIHEIINSPKLILIFVFFIMFLIFYTFLE